MNIEKNVLLRDYVSFKIGGPAEYFAKVNNSSELAEVLKWAKENNQSITILGGGTNMLISDKGLKGLVVKLNLNKLEFIGNKVTVGCGVPLALFLNEALAKNLTGLEFVAGVPGTVGGAIRGNAGTYGLAMGDVLKKIKYLDEDYQLREIDKDQANFIYRHSIFKEKKWIILEADIELASGDILAAKKLVEERLQYRNDTQPKQPSAGCIFKNVRFEDVDLEVLKNKNVEIDKFAKFKKIPAAYLIEKAGLKAYKMGNAQVSDIHANYIVNSGQATFDEVMMLISFVKQQVRDKYGVQLMEEVHILL